jgi:hypothetical protein
VESNSIFEVEEEEELLEEQELDQLLFMVLDFKVLLNHHLMLTTDSQHQTLSTEMDASTLTPTKV